MSALEVLKDGKRVLSPTIKALKAARVLKGLSRSEAGNLCGCSARAFEQLENGRSNPSQERIEKILRAFGMSPKEFAGLVRDPDDALSRAKSSPRKERSISRRPRRSCFRIITKEVRVLRVLRQRKGFSQEEASLRCGYTRAIFGQIENGRINIPPTRIEHIVTSLGHSMRDFEDLMKAEILRDEVVKECSEGLQKLDDSKLNSVRTIIVSLGGIPQ